MNTLAKKIGLGAVLAATALSAAAPADAQRWHRGYGHRGGDAGPAIVAGIAGLAIGAAIASDHSRDRYRDDYYRRYGYAGDYDNVYYRDHGYYPSNGYYAYDYQQRYGYSRCWTERRWDGYAHRRMLIRVCR